jgi:hypothetical protein
MNMMAATRSYPVVHSCCLPLPVGSGSGSIATLSSSQSYRDHSCQQEEDHSDGQGDVQQKP